MFDVFKNAWRIADLRKKILYTLLIIIIFRLGSHIPVPFLTASGVEGLITKQSGSILSYLDTLTGGALSKGSLFAMSITPYINASIIMQLLTVALPPLERMSKEGEEGRKKINRITRFVSLGIAIFQATALYIGLYNNAGTLAYGAGAPAFERIFTMIVIIMCFTAGASLIIWLGEQINEKGIGNGISMILFAGIVSRGPSTVLSLIMSMQADLKNSILVPLILVIFLLMIAFIILMTHAERRIPVQYAKRVVGRKMYGGQSTHIPIKVAMSGVMPIIFASSIMSLPNTIAQFFPPSENSVIWAAIVRQFSYTGLLYAVLYFFLIIGFNYFYVAISYNPIEIANNLKKNNGAIPGYRPGKPTSDFITNSLSKISLIGAIFLGIIAIFPIVFGSATGLSNIALGGTSILIVVGVALETVRQLESQMMMRHHKGFLE